MMKSAMHRTVTVLVWALIGSAAPSLAAPPQVTSAFPISQSVNAPANASIQVTFDTLIDPATVDSITFRVWGRWSGPASGTYEVLGDGITFTPSEPFFAGEWVTVNLSKGIESLAGQGMAKGYAWNFWIRTASTPLALSYAGRVTARQGNETWVSPYGAYAGDLDNDGWGDITVIDEQTNDARVYMSSSGSFSSFSVEGLTDGNVPSPNDMGDFDNDGQIDLAVGNVSSDKVSILFGNGSGDFPDGRKTSYAVVAGTANSVRGVGIVDLNGDGWDDIVAANKGSSIASSNVSILLNDGDGTFGAAVAKEAGGNGEFSIAIADANNDGQLDVFCGLYSTPRGIVVLLSNGNGGLTAQPPVGVTGRPWQIVAGDFNGDGNVDIAANDVDGSRMAVLLGNGSGGLGAPAYYATGLFPLAIDAGDIDGDGDLELVSSNYSAGTWTLYENNGSGVFVNPQTLNSSSSGSCATLHDRDNDGDLDMTGVDEIDDWVYFFANNSPPTAATPAVAGVTLYQNHPNPFNPTTTIRFELRKAARVELNVFDAQGALVATLARGEFPAGASAVTWNGMDARGERVASGVYFYRLVSARDTLTRKMVLLK